MSAVSPIISIKAKARHHAIFLMMLACILLLFTLLISQAYWHQYRLVFIFIYLTILVIFITGLVKKLEPPFSFTLHLKGIQYNHKYGKWQVKWHQIHRIAVVKETSGFDQIDLPYIGIKLKNIDDLAEKISPRLANRLIHEQKPLISLAVKQRLITLEESLLNFNLFTLASGEKIKGPLAAFLYHSKTLEKAFSYHLYLPETSADRDIADFCTLLNRCMKSVKDND